MKWIVIFSLAIALCGIYFAKKSRNNVCKTFGDYYTDRDKNPNCYYNPDADLTVPQIIQSKGYPVRTYNTATKDGYILTLFRIPHGKVPDGGPKQPVFLQHGYGMNSASFVNLGSKSLAFMLADAGYDVWLGNFRGTIYSKNHTHLSDLDMKYWEFSIDELGLYDVPAEIDLIYSITKQKITYIGFSMGTITGYMYGTSYPEVASERIKIFISLSPAPFLTGGPLWFQSIFWMWPYVEPILHWMYNAQISMRGAPNSAARRMICSPLPIQMYICQLPDMLVWGLNYEQNDPETLPITLMQNADWSSFEVTNQIIQFSINGIFEYRDYGPKVNKIKYGSLEPPKYDLSKLKVPTYLIRAENDLGVTKENVEKLNRSLPNEVKPYDIYVIKYDKFNHGDFLTAKDVVPLLYDHIVHFISKL